jgi:hypothetical protein
MSIKLEVSLWSSGETDAPRISIHVALQLVEAMARDPAWLQEKLAQLVQLAQQTLALNPGRDREASSKTGPDLHETPASASSGQEPPLAPPAHPGSAPPARAVEAGGALARLATVAQIRAIVRLAQERRFHLGRLLQAHFHVQRLEDLTRPQASALIDLLKSGRYLLSMDCFVNDEKLQGDPEKPAPD